MWLSVSIVALTFVAAPVAAGPSTASSTALGFIENVGQWAEEARFAVRSPGLVTHLVDDGMVLRQVEMSRIDVRKVGGAQRFA